MNVRRSLAALPAAAFAAAILGVAGCSDDEKQSDDGGRQRVAQPESAAPQPDGVRVINAPPPPGRRTRDNGQSSQAAQEETRPPKTNPDDHSGASAHSENPPSDAPEETPAPEASVEGSAAGEPHEAPQEASEDTVSDPASEDEFPKPEEPKPLEPPPEAKDAKRFVEGEDLWVDLKNKRVVLAGRVVQRGEHVPLELLACKKGTKEHEAIVAVQVTAFFVHTCLAGFGEFGHPVRFWTVDRKPMYEPAEGSIVKVTVYWDDEDGSRRSMPAQEWLRNSRTGGTMDVPWVFAGSQFWKPTPEDKPYYLAEDGDLICVSNFPSALLDLPVESSAEESNLVYQPFTKNIPPVGTPVAIVLEVEPGIREPITAPLAQSQLPPAEETRSDDPGSSESANEERVGQE
jgi:hypothetical protein